MHTYTLTVSCAHEFQGRTVENESWDESLGYEDVAGFLRIVAHVLTVWQTSKVGPSFLWVREATESVILIAWW